MSGLNKLKGHGALLGANVIWGLYAPLGKDLLNANVMSPLALCGLKIVGAAFLFCLLWAVVKIVNPSAAIANENIEKKDWPKLWIASIMIIAANQLFIILGMKYASPIDGTVLCGITPFMTLILSLLFLKQKIGWMKGVGTAIGFCGMLLFVFGGEVNTDMNVTNPVLGDSLVILSQLCGAIYLVFSGDILGKYSSFTLMKWMFLISSIVLLPLYGPQVLDINWNAMNSLMWTEFAYIILFATFMAYLLLPIGQKNVSPTVVAMYNYLQPVVATVYALLFGIAVLTGQTVLAAVLVFVGVWMVNKNQ